MRIMRAERAVARYRRVWGHAPPGNFWNFRRSEIDSGAFWDTCTSGKVHVHVQINYAVGIIVDFRSMACYATRVVRARAKTTP